MRVLNDDDLRSLLVYLEVVGRTPDVKLTQELQEKIKLILSMNRSGRITMGENGSAAIGGDANNNTFNLAPIIHLYAQEQPVLEQVVAIYNFDLSELIDDCLDFILMNPHGVVGFGLPCNIPRLLPSVCERLRIRLGVENADVKDYVALDKSFAASIQEIVDDFLLTHKVARIPNTIFSVQTFENDSALDFWQHLKTSEINLQVGTRLVLLMSVEEDFEFPANMYKLPPPKFRPAHIQDFFMRVVSTQKFKWGNVTTSKVVDRWVKSMIGYCTSGEILYQKSVYHYLKITLDEFRTNTDPDMFIKFLEDLEELA